MARFSDEERGKVDLISVLSVVGGIPAMVAFFLILFFFAHACDIPA